MTLIKSEISNLRKYFLNYVFDCICGYNVHQSHMPACLF